MKTLDQRRRRFWVVVMYFGLTLLVTSNPVIFSMVRNPTDYIVLFAFLTIGGLLVLFGSFGNLKWVTQEIANQKDGELDERQQTVRNRAYLRSYRILSVAVMVLVLYVQISVDFDISWLPPLDRVVGFSIPFGFLWLVITLPTAIIAWNEPDPIPDE